MDTKPKLPAHIKERINSVQKRLRRQKAQALLVTNRQDVRYLTGFAGDDSWLVVKQRGSKVILISDSRFEEEIKREIPHVVAVIRKQGMVDELKKILNKEKITRLALQPAHVTIAQRKVLVKKLGAKNLQDADDGLLGQRAIKQDLEIENIRKAVSIQQRAFKQTLKFLKTGQSEKQIAAYLEYQMSKLGSDGCSFPTIVAIDENSALPHAIPGEKKLKKGSSILFDFGAKYNGYCSDLTRVVGFGGMDNKVREIYEVVLAAQQEAIKTISAGVEFKDVDKVARDIITRAGFGKHFGHSLGHGIGLDIHEQPVLAPRAKGKLEIGQVVTVEPGIYIPGVGGVRIEDDVLVTESGYKVLSSLPKSFETSIV